MCSSLQTELLSSASKCRANDHHPPPIINARDARDRVLLYVVSLSPWRHTEHHFFQFLEWFQIPP